MNGSNNINSHEAIKSVRSSTGDGDYVLNNGSDQQHCSIDEELRNLSLSPNLLRHQQSSAVLISPRCQPRRISSVPLQRQRSSAQPRCAKTSTSLDVCELLHIVTHEYIGADCALRPGERLVVVDNGDKDWKHGFKLNDYMERMVTFPSTCVAPYRPEERPMRLVRNCNLVDQKIRLYRDQIVFVLPNSLESNGRVVIRNEHNKIMHCPIQFLTNLK
ncbi:hypothetical protein niasHT_017924 [Heterodera trifolii]|uniref:STAC3-related SH3 domain-containing protein n=1 Tax=Heterodera trifolii TaxID=157864 RepID=A0ABD2LIM6_9BILA